MSMKRLPPTKNARGKGYDEKIQDAIPKDAQDLAIKATNVAPAVKNDVVEKFQERLDEGTDRAQTNNDPPANSVFLLHDMIDDVCTGVYETTKSPRVKEQENFQNAFIMDKIEMIQAKEDENNRIPFRPPLSCRRGPLECRVRRYRLPRQS
ncbi:expressed unknown protein [Seminavis robusta]|uniref:Uncharacterized protein n=1 Tax=Seminavis robusta TaxID=568900 RepID=A0A9N8EAP9_9STRA|nr:expressed unknown protein [Seminavis robusta]|eukprot:Sro812_g206000.1 n/a (151) ;mRNA; r:4009-4461